MRCRKKASAFTAGVLSILLIFTLFSSADLKGFTSDASEYVRAGNLEDSCSMNSSDSAIPFAGTRLLASSGADAWEENRYLNISGISVVVCDNAIGLSEKMYSSAMTDRHAGFLVRLLI